MNTGHEPVRSGMAVFLNQPTTGATVLIVDDDASAREGLRSVFENAGHRTIAASDAPSALRLLHKQPCDLVMLDVELPEIDGLTFCRLLRAQPAMQKLPVVVFSASDSEVRKVEAFNAGVDDYIVKPSTPGELLSRVTSHLNIAQRESELLGSNRELSFLADLGRGLLRTLYPEQVARRVAGSIFEGTNAALSGCAVKNNGHGLAVCVFDREGSAENAALLDLEGLEKWLASAGSAKATSLTNQREFLIRDQQHETEYLAPILFGGKVFGALVVAFSAATDCTADECRLIDAAAQQAALAAHISSLYLGARESDLAYIQDHARELVIKTTGDSGGYGMLMGPFAAKKEIETYLAQVKKNPGNYIAQPLVELSAHPTYIDGKFEGRRIDLRPFILYGASVRVLPGGLTRVALRPGSYVVNSSQGGGSKDTWVLADKNA